MYPAGLGLWKKYESASNDPWNFHQISWYNYYVVDAAAKIDNDADPTQSPPSTGKLASGDVSITNYKDKLTEDDVDDSSPNPSDLEF